jgi:hypothetical protein
MSEPNSKKKPRKRKATKRPATKRKNAAGKPRKRSSAKLDAEQARIDERRKLVMQYRVAGLNYRQIIEQLERRHGITASKGTISSDINQELAHISEEKRAMVERLRALELERLDDISRTLYQTVRGGDLAAIDRYLRVSERRAKLMGLDAPQKIDAKLTSGVEDMTEEELDAIIAEDKGRKG